LPVDTFFTDTSPSSARLQKSHFAEPEYYAYKRHAYKKKHVYANF